jgi:hypothetical protein
LLWIRSQGDHKCRYLNDCAHFLDAFAITLVLVMRLFGLFLKNTKIDDMRSWYSVYLLVA